ncbi:hypothetical protein P9112_010014 [Eukaryota sp. TZLM1-RC]
MKRFLINYLKPLDPDAYVFYTTVSVPKSREGRPIYSRPITRKTAWKNLKEAGQRAGVPQNVGSHSLRKTFGLNHYEFHKNIALLQEIFGHHGPRVTERYIGLTDEKCHGWWATFAKNPRSRRMPL